MKKFNTLIVALLLTGGAFAQTWTVDKSHAKLSFEITHFMISDVDGAFTSFDAKITSSKEDFSDAVIELTADAASINTASEGRDKHLKNEDFFDVEKFKTLSFKSTSLKLVEGKKYKLTGDLTMHGVTKQVELDATFTGPIVHPYNKKTVAGLKIAGVVKRSDFGIGAKYPSAALGEEVIIKANGEFVKN